ncbi:hypothetical protein D3C81_1822520 [compost metagenome]
MREQHGAAQFVIALILADGQCQVRQHCTVECVAFAGAIQTDQKQLTALFAGDSAGATVGFVHLYSP